MLYEQEILQMLMKWRTRVSAAAWVVVPDAHAAEDNFQNVAQCPGDEEVSNMNRTLLPIALVTLLASAPVAPAAEAQVEVKVEARVVPVIDGCRDLNKNGKVDPYENWRLPIEKRVEDLLSRMTLQEKIGQMSYPSLAWDREDPAALIVEDNANRTTAKHEVDNSAGFMMIRPFPSTRACAEAMNQIQQWAESTRLGIPLIMGIDPHTQIVLV
ncbi:MAG: hypothetical protein NTU53_22065 [Planctomycetota bacterium]|nr:hypothetical protein [Planctomycetota bacterium]